MTTRTLSVATGMLLLAGLLAARAPVSGAQSGFQHVLSSGTFGLPSNARSVDWMVLNNSPDSQIVRVTVYQDKIGIAKTVLSPPITMTLLPHVAGHNANGVGSAGPFHVGGTYEVVVELNDKRVLPAVDVWRTTGAVIVPGTHLSPQDFTDVK